MVACASCGEVIQNDPDETGEPLSPWMDAEDRPYCDQCFWELYTVFEEKAIGNWNHDDRRVRERARNKVAELEKVWGIKS